MTQGESMVLMNQVPSLPKASGLFSPPRSYTSKGHLLAGTHGVCLHTLMNSSHGLSLSSTFQRMDTQERAMETLDIQLDMGRELWGLRYLSISLKNLSRYVPGSTDSSLDGPGGVGLESRKRRAGVSAAADPE